MSEVVEILKTLLERLGGNSTIRELGGSYFSHTNSYIDLRTHGVKTFVEYLKRHKNDFCIYSDGFPSKDHIRVRLVKTAGARSLEASPNPSIAMKDFNAWQMPPPSAPPRKLQSAPKQKIEWLKPNELVRCPEQEVSIQSSPSIASTDFLGGVRVSSTPIPTIARRLEQARIMQYSPSILSVASTDFLEGVQVSSTPLPPELDSFHDETLSELNYGRTESVCSRTRRKIKSWTPSELAKLKMTQEPKIDEKKVAPQSVASEFQTDEDDDTTSIPDLVSMHSIGSMDDIEISVMDELAVAEQIVTNRYEPDDEDSDSSDGEHYENNVYDLMKSISCLNIIDASLGTEGDLEITDDEDYSYERLEDFSDALGSVQSLDDSNCAAGCNRTQGAPAAAASETIRDPDATIVDPLQFITTLRFDDDLFLAKFPAVILDASVQLRLQDVPTSGEFDIYISEVYSPQNFWFQYTHDVEMLMDQLEEDYCGLHGQQLMISDENIVPGLLVACFLPEFDRWHRATVIKGVNSNDEARLLCVDYGTVGNIKKHHIRFLFERYLIYPRYSHRGRFENLKPPNGDKSWNEQQVSKFLIKVSDMQLSAKVLKFHEDERVYDLDITLTYKNDNQLNLRTWLIDNWLCEAFTLKPDCIYPMCYYFPSFDMLEKNYPTFHEKSLLMIEGVDYDLLVETNFFENVNEATLTRRAKLLSMLGCDRYRDAKKYYFGM